jgi:hypothetical protein
MRRSGRRKIPRANKDAKYMNNLHSGRGGTKRAFPLDRSIIVLL